jgi:hypothetical protein
MSETELPEEAGAPVEIPEDYLAANPSTADHGPLSDEVRSAYGEVVAAGAAVEAARLDVVADGGPTKRRESAVPLVDARSTFADAEEVYRESIIALKSAIADGQDGGLILDTSR